MLLNQSDSFAFQSSHRIPDANPDGFTHCIPNEDPDGDSYRILGEDLDGDSFYDFFSSSFTN